MLFNSANYVIFFLGVLFFNYIVPRRFRYIYLTLVSLLFILSFNAKVIVSFFPIAIFLSLLSFFGAFAIEKSKKKSTLFIFVGVTAAALLLYKCSDFGNVFLRKCLSLSGIDKDFSKMNFPAPLGLSYISFQVISYLADVYKGKVSPQKNFIKHFLYIIFFAKLVAGPIERAGDFFKQLELKAKFDIRNMQIGMLYMLYGFFMKMLLADRAAIFVNAIFDNYEQYSGWILFLAVALYSVQIYADFAGYSLIAFGTAKTLGITINPNFYQPYFSKSVGEFWKRWHISLSSWLKDYIYIPLGGNRKGKARTYVNLAVTFLASGFWHGSSLNFVVWGGLHALYQICGRLLKPLREKIAGWLKLGESSFLIGILQHIFTCVLVSFAWIFFRAKSLKDSLFFIKRLADIKNFFAANVKVLFDSGLNAKEWLVFIIALFVVFAIDFLREKTDLADNFLKQNSAFKWISTILFALAIIVFGVYGGGYNAADFVYFNF